jgi:hypothetical protein
MASRVDSRRHAPRVAQSLKTQSPSRRPFLGAESSVDATSRKALSANETPVACAKRSAVAPPATGRQPSAGILLALGLYEDDLQPAGISFEDAYGAIRAWYQGHVDGAAQDPQRGHHAVASKAYIESLAPPDQASRGDIEDTLRRVLSADLEWGYHESDGQYKMAAYAHAAFDAAGVNPFH